jgi:AcrR family transcriptional regulator
MNSGASRRAYRMGARADAAAATGERILDAAEELFWEVPLEQVSLAQVAAAAGVTVQTVIRRFGSRAGVIEAAVARATDQVREHRNDAPIGDVAGAVANLVEHYEALGARSLKLLAEEGHSPMMAAIVEGGRAFHHDWVARTFAPQLAACQAAARPVRTAQLVAITDVYTWKVLRRDCGLGVADVERALRELIDGLEAD